MSALCSLLFFDSVLKDSLKLIGLDPVLVNLVAKSQFLIFTMGIHFHSAHSQPVPGPLQKENWN